VEIKTLRTKVARRSAQTLRNAASALDHLVDRSSIEHTLNNGRSQQEEVIASTSYNMVTSAGENYYREQYLTLASEIEMSPQSILDLGTGHGRIALDLAKMYPLAHVFGSDLSETAIAFAKEESRRLDITNVSFSVADIASVLSQTPTASIDLIVFTEVALYLENLETQLAQMAESLRKGGFLMASFRSTYFNALLTAKRGAFQDAERIARNNQGRLFAGSNVVFNWHSSAQILDLLHSLGLVVRLVSGIGVLSGIPGDPHSSFARPWALSDKEAQSLMQAEIALGKQVPDAGRYIFVVAERG